MEKGFLDEAVRLAEWLLARTAREVMDQHHLVLLLLLRTHSQEIVACIRMRGYLSSGTGRTLRQLQRTVLCADVGRTPRSPVSNNAKWTYPFPGQLWTLRTGCR